MVTKFTHTQYDTWKGILKQIRTEIYEESKEFQETEYFYYIIKIGQLSILLGTRPFHKKNTNCLYQRNP